jgi:hypothetical protein
MVLLLLGFFDGRMGLARTVMYDKEHSTKRMPDETGIGKKQYQFFYE